MSETNFLNSILETEGVAGEMIFNAKAAMKDRISQARKQADEIRNRSKAEASEKHRECIAEANREASAAREAILADAAKDADMLKEKASMRLDKASEKTAEGIVKIFADR